MKRSQKQRAQDQQRHEEVREILAMFTRIKEAYGRLQDKAGIKECWVEFEGFDSHTEPEHKRALREVAAGGRPYGTLGHIADLDSRSSTTLRRYRRMLEAWKASGDPSALTKEDLVRITNVRIE